MARLWIVAVVLLTLAAPSAAQAAEDDAGHIQGWVLPKPDRGKPVDVVLQIRTSQGLERIPLHTESKKPYTIAVTEIPAQLKRSAFYALVEVNSPPGYESSEPEYLRSAGQPLVFDPLYLRPKSEAYQNWVRAATTAGQNPDSGIRWLLRLESWELLPDQKLEVAVNIANLWAYGKQQWKRHQELLREAFDPEAFGTIGRRRVANYFRARFKGFERLVPGNPSIFAAAILSASDLSDLWASLVDDFAGHYSSHCKLDDVLSSTQDLTSELVAAQRKALRTWLGRPGRTASECPASVAEGLPRGLGGAEEGARAGGAEEDGLATAEALGR